ncbi:MAG: hypothetical protein KDB27_19405, partial [Planctomycetales bacterium]|nr:hypothetical protein [Planctomycetales bacterium]
MTDFRRPKRRPTKRRNRRRNSHGRRLLTQSELRLELSHLPSVETLEDRRMLAADITNVSSYTQSGPLEIEIGGLTPGTSGHDQTNASTDATINGLLNVTLLNGFQPSVGNTFEFLTFPTGTLAGKFTSATGLYGFGDGSLYFDVVETATSLQLVVKELPGAADAKPTTTDLQDAFGTFYSSYFSLTTPQTISGDLLLNDYNYVRGNFTLNQRAAETVDITRTGLAPVEKEVTTLTLAATGAHSFFGAGGSYWTADTDADGEIDQNEINTNAVGFSMTDVDFGLAVMAPTTFDGSVYHAVQSNAGVTTFVGDLIDLTAHEVSVDIDGGTENLAVDLPAAVNFRSSYETSVGANDGQLAITIRTDTDPATPDTIDLSGTGPRARVTANNATLSVS